MTTEILVNGLPLLDALMSAIESGRWTSPIDDRIFQAAFPLHGIVQPLLLGIDGILRENNIWLSSNITWLVGVADAANPPGDVDPSKTVLIGDLGPDIPIALDYRLSLETTRVLYLIGNSDLRWVEAAPDIEALLVKLGIS